MEVGYITELPPFGTPNRDRLFPCPLYKCVVCGLKIHGNRVGDETTRDQYWATTECQCGSKLKYDSPLLPPIPNDMYMRNRSKRLRTRNSALFQGTHYHLKPA